MEGTQQNDLSDNDDDDDNVPVTEGDNSTTSIDTREDPEGHHTSSTAQDPEGYPEHRVRDPKQNMFSMRYRDRNNDVMTDHFDRILVEIWFDGIKKGIYASVKNGETKAVIPNFDNVTAIHIKSMRRKYDALKADFDTPMSMSDICIDGVFEITVPSMDDEEEE